jgi:hypothetical protein
MNAPGARAHVQVVCLDLTEEIVSLCPTGEVLLIDGPKLEAVLRPLLDAEAEAERGHRLKWSTRTALAMSHLLSCAIVDLQAKPVHDQGDGDVADGEVRRSITRASPFRRLVLYNQAHKRLAVGKDHFRSTDLVGGALALLSVPPIAEYISQHPGSFRGSGRLQLGPRKISNGQDLIAAVRDTSASRVQELITHALTSGYDTAMGTLRVEVMVDASDLESGRLALKALMLRLCAAGAIVRVPYAEYRAVAAAIVDVAQTAANLGAIGTQLQMNIGLSAYVPPRESLLRTWKESMLMLLVEGRLTWTYGAYRGCRSELQAYMMSKNLVGAPAGRILAVVPADNPDAFQELLNIPDAEAERLVIDIWGPSRIRTLVRDPKCQDIVTALLRFWNQVRYPTHLLFDSQRNAPAGGPRFEANAVFDMITLLSKPLLDLLHEELYVVIVGGRTGRPEFPLSSDAMAKLKSTPSLRSTFTNGKIISIARTAGRLTTTTVDKWIAAVLSGQVGLRVSATPSVLAKRSADVAPARPAPADELPGADTAVASAVRCMVGLFDMAATETLLTAQPPAAAAAAAAAAAPRPAAGVPAVTTVMTHVARLRDLLPGNVAGLAQASQLFKAVPNASPTATWKGGKIEFADPVWSSDLPQPAPVPPGATSAMAAASAIAAGVRGNLMVAGRSLSQVAAMFPEVAAAVTREAAATAAAAAAAAPGLDGALLLHMEGSDVERAVKRQHLESLSSSLRDKIQAPPPRQLELDEEQIQYIRGGRYIAIARQALQAQGGKISSAPSVAARQQSYPQSWFSVPQRKTAPDVTYALLRLVARPDCPEDLRRLSPNAPGGCNVAVLCHPFAWYVRAYAMNRSPAG